MNYTNTNKFKLAGNRLDALIKRLDDSLESRIAGAKRLYARPGTAGEKAAAGEALKRMGVNPEERKSSNKSGGSKFTNVMHPHGWKASENRVSPHADIHWTHRNYPEHTIYTGEGGVWSHHIKSHRKSRSINNGNDVESLNVHLNKFHKK